MNQFILEDRSCLGIQGLLEMADVPYVGCGVAAFPHRFVPYDATVAQLDHAPGEVIGRMQIAEALVRTRERRPDLLERTDLSAEEREYLQKLKLENI